MIQLDMPMPTNCLDCPACNEYLMCAIPINGRKWAENDVREFGQGRPEWCPMKEQEARLLTEEEIQKLDEGQFVWIQIKDDMLYCLEIIGMCGVPGKYTDIQFNAPASFPELNIEKYKKIWVAWTTQPTEEQQDEVKWDA